MAPCNTCGRLISCTCDTGVAPHLGSTSVPVAEMVTPADVPQVQITDAATGNSQMPSFRTYSEWAAERMNFRPSLSRETPEYTGFARFAMKWLMGMIHAG